MHFRDLISTRLGGSIIARHICLPDRGPVQDMLHYHKVGFQLVFFIKDWADVVYEDQGSQHRHAGDCTIQEPKIRHPALEASDAIEVIDVDVLADNITMFDREKPLPKPSAYGKVSVSSLAKAKAAISSLFAFWALRPATPPSKVTQKIWHPLFQRCPLLAKPHLGSAMMAIF
ncbi:MAG: hypothetical protein ACI9O0_000636 [Paracoccaceae bacterium]|jgi:hypothetical protein